MKNYTFVALALGSLFVLSAFALPTAAFATEGYWTDWDYSETSGDTGGWTDWGYEEGPGSTSGGCGYDCGYNPCCEEYYPESCFDCRPYYEEFYIEEYFPSYSTPHYSTPHYSPPSYSPPRSSPPIVYNPSYPTPPAPRPQPPVFYPPSASSNSNVNTNTITNTNVNVNNIDNSNNSINNSFNTSVTKLTPVAATPVQYPVQYVFPPVIPPPPPVPNLYCTIAISPTYIQSGQTAFLSWTSAGASSAWLSDGLGVVAPNGSLAVRSNVSTTYTLTVSGYGGTRTCQAYVNVAPAAPYVSLSQIPYTGFGDSVQETVLWLGIVSFLLSALYLAYFFLLKPVLKRA